MAGAGRRMVVVLLTAAVLLVGMAGPAAAAEPESAPPSTTQASEVSGLAVLSYRHWVHDGALHIVGEIRNTSTKRINPYVLVGIVPGHNSPTDTLYEIAGVWSLAPGARSPFHVFRSPFSQPSTSVTFVSAGGYVVEEAAAAVGLSVIPPVGSDPTLGAGTGDSVLYEVRNATDRPVRLLRVAAGFRRADGRISNVGGGVLGVPVDIPPGGSHQAWVTAPPSGVLATTATVDIVADFADGAQETVVSWSNWFHDTGANGLLGSIAWLAEEGITVGCAARLYCPAAAVTRAQMAIFLDRALALSPATADHFTDDTGVTGESSINALFEAEITVGCAPGRFCPSAKVTRAQMALFLDRAFSLPPTGVDFFTDDTGVTGEAAINRLAAAGITTGCGGTKFCPGSAVTRAQMAAFLHRAMDPPE